jgi:hypothetical protein
MEEWRKLNERTNKIEKFAEFPGTIYLGALPSTPHMYIQRSSETLRKEQKTGAQKYQSIASHPRCF